jgi:hypothetical protein
MSANIELEKMASTIWTRLLYFQETEMPPKVRFGKIRNTNGKTKEYGLVHGDMAYIDLAEAYAKAVPTPLPPIKDVKYASDSE